MDSTKNILDYINILLRYVASGLVAVFTYMYVKGYGIDSCKDYKETSTVILLLTVAGVIGLFAYSIHHALIDKCLYYLSISFYLKNNRAPDNLKKITEGWNKKTNLKRKIRARMNRGFMFQLINQTYLRKSSENKQLSNIQKEISSSLAVLNFLYCSLYFLIIIPTYFYFRLGSNKDLIYNVYFLAGMVFLSAVSYDYSTTRREMWVVDNFFQDPEQYLVNTNNTFTDKSK